MTDSAHTIAAFLASKTPLVPCKACGQSGHAITACPAIRAVYDQAEPPSDAQRWAAIHTEMAIRNAALREQLANAHEAMGTALALLRQDSASGAEIVLELGLHGVTR